MLSTRHGACEAQIEGICVGQAVHLHHRKMRSQGGPDGWPNTMPVCLYCHGYIQLNPKWSYEHGFLIRSYAEIEPL